MEKKSAKNMEKKPVKSAKYMNILGVLLDQVGTGKGTSTDQNSSSSNGLRQVDSDWLKRCSVNELDWSSDEETKNVAGDNHNPKKRPLSFPDDDDDNEIQDIDFAFDIDQIDDEDPPPVKKNKFFKTRLYTPTVKPIYKVTFNKLAKDKDHELDIVRKKITPAISPKSAKSVTLRSSTKENTKKKKKASLSTSKVSKSTTISVSPKTSSSKLTAVYDVYDEVSTRTGDGGNRKGAFKRTRKAGAGGRANELRRSLKNMNDNFVRIDIEKKKFVRGKKKITGAQTKRIDWKRNKGVAAKESRIKTAKCHKCGEIGHYAKYCLKDLMDKELVPVNTDSSPFPTLQEAARMVWSQRSPPASPNTTVSIYKAKTAEEKQTDSEGNGDDTETTLSLVPIGNPKETEELSLALVPKTHSEQFVLATSAIKSVEPLLGRGGLFDEQELLTDGLAMFNFSSFRPGQQEAISRVLHGLSTLLVLGTGTGKSLCYQLPAYLYAQQYPGVLSLCISPLVSLMEDQVKHVPAFLRAACLHTQMTTRQKELVLEKIRSKKLDVLLVSPEAICSGLFGLLRNVEEFPSVAFACIDEVHCVSEWSHNFRPSYLKLCKVLREKLNVKTILGLTATATNYTAFSVCEHLKIEPSTIIQGEILPTNLSLTVSRDIERDRSLIELLNGERFNTCDSIIIYCTRRSECDRVATLVRTCLQPICKLESGRNICEVYHAGQRASTRRRVQNDFMSGKTRIVVATVAFGMGINKSDIRAIIHYNMPKTFESYVQEIGRAGRDGLSAECHLFLDSARGKDLAELKRHIFSNYVDRSTIRALLKKIFRPCKCARIEKLKGTIALVGNGNMCKLKPCNGHEVSFSVNDTSIELDLAEENIETILCYLELDTNRKWIEILPKCYQFCKVQSYGGFKLLLNKALTCPPLAAAMAMLKEKKKFKEGDMHLEFNLVDLAANLDWNSAVVRRELKSMEWTGIKFDDQGRPTAFRKSGLLVEFSDLAHRMVVPGNLTDDDYDHLLDSLHKRCVDQEKMQLYQLQKIYHSFQFVSTPNVLASCDSSNPGRSDKSDKLKEFILEYFGQTSISIPANWKYEGNSLVDMKEETIRQDVRNLLASQPDTQFTGRAIAKIFQGIPSPCYPAEHWNRNRAFWRKHLDADFDLVVRMAGEEIVHWK